MFAGADVPQPETLAAVPLAALLEGTVDVRDARVGIILSGGHVDLDALPW